LSHAPATVVSMRGTKPRRWCEQPYNGGKDHGKDSGGEKGAAVEEKAGKKGGGGAAREDVFFSPEQQKKNARKAYIVPITRERGKGMRGRANHFLELFLGLKHPETQKITLDIEKSITGGRRSYAAVSSLSLRRKMCTWGERGSADEGQKKSKTTAITVIFYKGEKRREKGKGKCAWCTCVWGSTAGGWRRATLQGEGESKKRKTDHHRPGSALSVVKVEEKPLLSLGAGDLGKEIIKLWRWIEKEPRGSLMPKQRLQQRRRIRM